MSYYSLLVIIAVLSTASVVSTQSLLYVLPADDDSTECPVSNTQQCLTLSQLQSSVLVESHTVLNFVAGVHSLQSVLSFTDLENLTIVGSSGSEFEPTIISCNPNSTSDSGLILMNITTFVMRDIVINGCHVRRTQEQLMLSKYAKTFLNFSLPVQFGVFLNYLYDVELTNVRVHNCTGYGMLAFNLLGDSYARNLDFFGNNRIAIENSSCFDNVGLACKGGNLVLVYTDLLDCPINPLNYSITIADSSFTNGVDAGVAYVTFISIIDRNDLQFIAGAGIGLHMMQSSYGLNALIENCTMEDNAAFTGASAYLSMWDFVDNSTMAVKNSTIKGGVNPLGDSVVIAGSFDLATGFYYDYGLLPIGDHSPTCEVNRKYETKVFTMEDCVVIDNEATLASAGFIQEWPKTFLDYPREVTLTRVKFVHNNGDATLVLYGQGVTATAFKTYLIECEFIGNFYQRVSNSYISSSNHQVIYQISMPYAEYINCTWSNNRVSSLHAIQSRFVLSGENRFINNSAVNGAGLEIQEGSEVFLQTGSKTIFIGNHAEEFGGAIYAFMLTYRCFYQFDTSKEPLPVLFFSNNTADMAGQSVYGDLRLCILGAELYTETSIATFLEISDFTESFSTNTSIVSSGAIGLCVCFQDFIKNCGNVQSSSYYPLSSFPGKEFKVWLQAFAFFDTPTVIGGETPADVQASIIGTSNSSYGAFSKGGNMTQRINRGCNAASYTLTGEENQIIQISLSPISERLHFPAYIEVHLEECPSGFVYSSEELACICNQLFIDNGITCNLQTGEFIKGNDQWIGYVRRDGDPNPILAIATCTEVQYCNNTGTGTVLLEAGNLELTNGDDLQCINNRWGAVCGQCRPGYSLTLGSFECKKCSNAYLALFIVFILGGFLWLAFLSILNVTVKTGRINGMLFYANVIKLANYEFFSLQEPSFYVFQIMINWVNLDFGIVSCFYDGFDQYAKSWFSFLFPFYLLSIMLIITFLANRSSKFSSILPNNILPVFSTMLLICFTKLLRETSVSVAYQTLETENGDLVVWQYDSSINFFNLKHGFLMMFSLVMFLLVLVPLAIIMTVYPYLQSFTAHEDTIFEKLIGYFRKMIFKFKPLLETYDGPYLTKHRYYTGVLLLLRILILIIAVSVYTSTNSSQWFKPVSVSIICIVLLVLVISMKIYLSQINTIVELMFLFNLTVLEFIILIMELINISRTLQGIVVSCSIAVGFMTFAGVIVYEKYLVLAPVIYRCLGKEYRPGALEFANRRVHEEEKKVKSVEDNDPSLQVISILDEGRDPAVPVHSFKTNSTVVSVS